MFNEDINIPKMIYCIIFVFFLFTNKTRAVMLPEDPNNAALLYYQSYLVQPEYNDVVDDLLHPVFLGNEPSEEVREFMTTCHESIELVKAASKIPTCNWGIQYSKGNQVQLPQFLRSRDLLFILYVEAQILAADGNNRDALELCLAMRRFARHIGGDYVLLHNMAYTVDILAIDCIQDIIGSAQFDEKTLIWLLDKFSVTQGAEFLSITKTLEMDYELSLQGIRASNKNLTWIRNSILEKAEDESSRKEISNLSNEELITRIKGPYADYLSSALQVINSNTSYSDKCNEIEKQTKDLNERYNSVPVVGLMILRAKDVLDLYNRNILLTAKLNSLIAALEIYLENAKTGELPKKLPDGLPKDPYSGRDFEYEITQHGFILSCQVKPIDAKEKYEFEYKVEK